MPMPAALMIDLTRGPAVESRHAVHAVVLRSGKTEAVYGDAARPTFPRSAIKPLQAIALIESGAADAFQLSPAEIALACASHAGEDMHTTPVGAWLKRLGLDDAALECGAHAPYHNPCLPVGNLCNNCSGKHTGMLTLAKHLGFALSGYVDVNHPVQQKILQTVAEMCGCAITPESCGIDGCSAPNPVMTLENMAQGFASMIDPAKLSFKRGAACARILQSMRENPLLVGGSKRFDSAVIAESHGEIICKIGGEGVYACVVPALSTTIALKVEDGAIRAAQAALFVLLEKHGVFAALAEKKLVPADLAEKLRGKALPVQRNWRGTEVGTVRSEA